jgi:hypothetical protein
LVQLDSLLITILRGNALPVVLNAAHTKPCCCFVSCKKPHSLDAEPYHYLVVRLECSECSMQVAGAI